MGTRALYPSALLPPSAQARSVRRHSAELTYSVTWQMPCVLLPQSPQLPRLTTHLCHHPNSKHVQPCTPLRRRQFFVPRGESVGPRAQERPLSFDLITTFL